MQDLQEHYTNKDVVWLSIASSAKGKQGHYSAAEWKAILEEKGFHSTALLLDPNGQVGRMYGARTTPHMYVIDPEGFLVYQGGIDDRPSVDPGDILNSENYIRSVLNHILDGEETPYSSTEPYGCSVKY
jgi:hypothetical protein